MNNNNWTQISANGWFGRLDEFIFDPNASRDYLVKANWALYCDNYLEGFHIPFVHKDLNEVLDYKNYTTEVYKYCNLQIGYSEDDSEIFDPPKGMYKYSLIKAPSVICHLLQNSVILLEV